MPVRRLPIGRRVTRRGDPPALAGRAEDGGATPVPADPRPPAPPGAEPAGTTPDANAITVGPAGAANPPDAPPADDGASGGARVGWGWRDLLTDLKATFTAANLPGLAAEVAYSLVFALPSLVLMLVTIAVLADASTGSAVTGAIEATIRRQAPSEMRPLLLTMVATASERAAATAPTVGAAVSSLVALWVAGGGFAALAGACARAGGKRDARPFLVRRLLAAGSVLLLVVMLVVAFFLFVFGEAIGREIGQEVGGAQTFDRVWSALQEPLGLVIATGTLLFIYRVGAGVRRGWRWLLPGAALVAALLFALMRGFGLYLRLLDPGSAYGPAGSLVVLLFFNYAASFVIIGGAMLSAVLGRRYDSS